MYKLAILGCENSHADNFLRLIAEGKYPQMEVIGIYSNEPEAAKKLHDKFGTPIMEHYGDLAGQVDGVMITARHGDNHFLYAKPYLADGIPMFIDKPITCSNAEGEEFMAEAKARGIRLCGGSTCAATEETYALAETVRKALCGKVRGGSLACPYYWDSPYGGFYFYAQHLVEVMTAIFGEEIQQILAKKNGETLTFVAQYPEFSVTGTYAEGLNYYNVSVFGAKSARNENLKLTPDSFRHEMDSMLALLEGKPMEKTYESFLYPVYVMNAILRSLDSGAWEAVR